MLGTDISMDVLIQYELQTGNGMLIMEVRAFLAESASMTCISRIQFYNNVR
jgi:hypothetical protein